MVVIKTNKQSSSFISYALKLTNTLLSCLGSTHSANQTSCQQIFAPVSHHHDVSAHHSPVAHDCHDNHCHWSWLAGNYCVRHISRFSGAWHSFQQCHINFFIFDDSCFSVRMSPVSRERLLCLGVGFLHVETFRWVCSLHLLSRGHLLASPPHQEYVAEQYADTYHQILHGHSIRFGHAG